MSLFSYICYVIAFYLLLVRPLMLHWERFIILLDLPFKRYPQALSKEEVEKYLFLLAGNNIVIRELASGPVIFNDWKWADVATRFESLRTVIQTFIESAKAGDMLPVENCECLTRILPEEIPVKVIPLENDDDVISDLDEFFLFGKEPNAYVELTNGRGFLTGLFHDQSHEDFSFLIGNNPIRFIPEDVTLIREI